MSTYPSVQGRVVTVEENTEVMVEGFIYQGKCAERQAVVEAAEQEDKDVFCWNSTKAYSIVKNVC